MKPAKKKPVKKSIKKKSRAVAPKKKTTSKKSTVHVAGKPAVAKKNLSETSVLKKIKAENLRLTTQLAQKNRALEIESALERVRARTMAMRHSTELADAASILFKQLEQLGAALWTCGFAICDKYPDQVEKWMSSPAGEIIDHPLFFPISHPEEKEMYDAWRRGIPITSSIMEGEDLRKSFANLMTLPPMMGILNELKESDVPFPSWVQGFVITYKHGYLLIVTTRPFDESEIFIRFGKTFEQTYIRFLDLQKAEAQAQEAKIEAALERVRARAMAMHTSQELKEVTRELRKQMGLLGQKDLDTCVIHLHDESPDFIHSWASIRPPDSTDTILDSTARVPKKGLLIIEEALRAYSMNRQDYVIVNDGEKIKQWFEFIQKEVPEAFAKIVESARGVRIEDAKFFWSFADFAGGSLLMVTADKPEEPSRRLLRRFANVFGLAYQRFADLKQAEAQAREAQIEAALEKVRSASLAMHHSNELQNVVANLFGRMVDLGLLFNGALIWTFDREKRDIQIWVAAHAIPQPVLVRLPYDEDFQGNPIIKDFWEAVELGQDTINKTYSGNVKNDYFAYTAKYNDETVMPEHLRKLTRELDWTVSFAAEKNSLIGFDSWSGQLTTIEDFQILKRFARVFEQAYVRFLDLQKAEAQAREAQIEGALEKIRSRSLAMHNSQELREVITVFFEKLNELEVLLGTIGIALFDHNTKDLFYWVGNSIQDPQLISVPYNEAMMGHENFVRDGWNAMVEKTELINKVYSRAQKDSYFDYLFSNNDLSRIPDSARQILREMDSHTVCFFPNSNSALFADSWDGRQYTKDAINILRRAGKVFEQAYVRFLDLQKAEAQAREAQIETALERVRARAMAMHASQELKDVAHELRIQLGLLGQQELETCAIHLYNESPDYFKSWAAIKPPKSKGEIMEFQVTLPKTGSAIIDKLLQAYYSNQQEYVLINEGAQNEEWFHLLERISPDATGLLLESMNGIRPRDFRSYWACADFTGGTLVMVTLDLPGDASRSLLRRFSNVFGMAYQRFSDLQKAEAQAREAQIEAALERVRARTMAMHSSSELIETAELLFDQLTQLGAESAGVAFAICEPDNVVVKKWTSIGVFSVPYTFESGEQRMYEAWKNHTEIYEEVYEGERLQKYLELFMEIPEFKAGFQKYLDRGIPFPTWQKNHAITFKYGYLLLITYKPFEETQIFIRFAKVFEQTYTRFLDLQKAEAQAREAHIEAALEKVRSRSMGMQKSDELREVIQVIYEQFVQLNIRIDGAGFAMDYMESDDFNFWLADPTTAFPYKVHIPYFDHPQFNRYKEAKEKGLDFYTSGLTPEERNRFFDHISKYIPIPQELKEAVYSAPGYETSHVVLKNVILYILNLSGLPFSGADNDTLMRFGKVFEQTYTRFNDLQKAEAQAREAQIEAALERVRSRTMAMHKSDELPEAANLLFQQVQLLGMPTWSAGYCIWDEDKKAVTLSMSRPWGDIQPSFRAPLDEDPSFIHFLEGHNKGEELFIEEVSGEALVQNYKYLRTLPVVGEQLYSILKEGHPLPTSQVNHCAYFSKGFLLFITYEPVPHAHDIFKRFANVFEQTYTRFLDLQKAEAQAREAQIEASLERVRARTMGMQKSEDLRQVVKVLYAQLKELGFQKGLAAINIMDHDSGDVDSWSEGFDDGYDLPEKYHVPYFEHRGQRELIRHWKSGTPYATVEIAGEEKKSYDNYYFFHTDFVRVPETTKQFMMQQEVVLFSMAYMQYGALTWTPSPLSEEQSIILQRFAKVFEQSYTRFLDLQKAETQAREAQIEAALERVRSRTMAMHKSDELNDVAGLLFKQVSELGIKTWTTGFNVWSEDNNSYTDYVTSPQGNIIKAYTIDASLFPVFKEVSDAKKRGEEFFVQYLEGELLRETYKELTKFGDEGQYEKMLEDGFEFPSRQYDHFVFGSRVSLMFITYAPVPEAHEIFKRFGKVFEQSYTRFLDLQKAESQAREAQIEAALEKIRNRSLAMHHSDELREIIGVTHQMLGAVNVKHDTIAIQVFDFHGKSSVFWPGNNLSDVAPKVVLPYDEAIMREDTCHRDLWEAMTTGEPIINKVYTKKQKDRWFEYVFAHNDPTVIEEHARQFISQSETHTVCFFPEKNSGLFADSWDGSQYSEDDINVLKRVAKVFEQAYVRFLDLQKAEAQSRESQIEAALESVRASSMAMHRSDELKDVVKVVFEKLLGLGFVLDDSAVTILIFNDESKNHIQWAADPNHTYAESFEVPYTDHPLSSDLIHARENGIDFFSKLYPFEEKNNYFHYLFENTNYKFLPNDVKQLILGSEQYGISVAFARNSAILIPTNSGRLVTEPQEKILKRFVKVFDQAHARFLDLHKAEAQAREAQIEAALERVRSRSMAMHKSEELLEVIAVVSQQLQHLNLKFNTVSFATINQEHDYKFWFAPMGDPNPSYIQVPYLDNPMYSRMKDVLASGVDFYADTLTPEESRQWHEHMFAHADLSFLSAETKAYILRSGYARSIAITPSILLIVSNYAARPYSDDQNDIIKRFAAVFQQSYTRFLDLQKAEAQAREAIIEASLERVRARAMAMHSSQDLSATASLVFSELRTLNINPIRCGVGLLSKETRKAQLYSSTSSPEGDNLSLIGWVNLVEHPVLTAIYQSWLSGEDYFPVLSGESMKSYYQQLVSGLSVPVPNVQSDEKHYGYFFPVSIGPLYAWSLKPYEEGEVKILKRFASVIDLTFRRYMELEQSETIAREAMRQASLDRVRAEIASMRTAKDLERITPLIWKELTALDISFIRCGVFIMDEEHKIIHNYLSAPDGKAIAAFHLPFSTPGAINRILDHWQARKIFLEHWDDRAMEEFANILVTNRIYDTPDQYLKALPHGGFYLHFLPFNQGMLYVGSTMQLDDDSLKLIQSLADAFSTAYARYEDFNRLEAAKQQVDKTLVDLKQAQQQLVQSEKMASLGELTAGIAHEIQNPLNFVNNFSEVNEELLAEMKDELVRGKIEDALALANDVLENQKKINHHGKRADAIVKGMLQHSRTSAGQKEPTDLNALCDEYLRLSYHGYRAKDKSFNSKFETDFDSSLPKINVVPQDIGRVILNLINNAFYAVNEKAKGEKPSHISPPTVNYEPLVTVSTKNIGNTIQISVKDNGNGIPDGLKEKIFQPFFTTKPTGQGTGLGLSLSYDIVKAHGGELKVETKEGEGSTFVINLSL